MATIKKASATTATKKAANSKTTPEKGAAKKTTVAAKPAAKVAAPKTATTKMTTPAAKAATPVAKAAPRKVAPSAGERYRMVQDAAYYLAEKNGFKGGAMDYWIAAEAEIKLFLSGK